ncbi:MAG: PrsW family intramembrane metalloprotease [Verrucomicrobiae bacterium]|nr:PrsW family intramembrane metalloprotease [Verrucomicrobiae bacterium]
MPFTLNPWQLLGVTLASALFWMQYVDLKDRRKPEPRGRLLMAFVLGIVACGLAVLVYMALDELGVPSVKMGELRWNAFFCFVIVGPVEEGMKALVAYLIVFRWREFDEPIDGFVYAAAIALGFASMENFYNLPDLDWLGQLARTVALPLTHMLFAAIWGFGAAHARLAVPPGRRRLGWQIGTVALGMAAHGLYDYVIFAFQATIITSGMALVLWAFVIWRAHQCVKQAG